MTRLTLRLTALVLVAACAEADTARPVPLDESEPSRREIGQLVYRGGLEITDGHRHLGGLSALAISDDGSQLIALTDRGNRLEARLADDTGGSLVGFELVSITRLAGLEGRSLLGKHSADAESLAMGKGGEMYVAFERNHRVWRYDAAGTPTALPPIPLASELDSNSGIEALTRLPDGSLLAIAEDRVKGQPGFPAWLLQDGSWQALTYAGTKDFRPSGATTLPDGDVLVLERHYSKKAGAKVRIRRIAADRIAPGAALLGPVLAELAAPLTVDNFEGIATITGPGDETLVYLVSDDNFSGKQRTLLLKFAFTGGGAAE
jgi:hypothetical protein